MVRPINNFISMSYVLRNRIYGLRDVSVNLRNLLVSTTEYRIFQSPVIRFIYCAVSKYLAMRCGITRLTGIGS